MIMPRRKVGRPTKYKPEYCEKLIKFFNKEPYIEKKTQEVDKKGNKKTITKHIVTDLPLLCKFAADIGVNQDTLHEWSKNHKEFSEAMKTAKEMQKNILVINGLRGNYDTGFAKFVAINATDMVDKKEHDLSLSGGVDNKLDINVTFDE